MILEKNQHKNPHLQNVWNKYQGTCFICEPLKIVEKRLLKQTEQHFINTLTPEYNLNKDVTTSADMKGSKNPNWKGGISPVYRRQAGTHVPKIRNFNGEKNPRWKGGTSYHYCKKHNLPWPKTPTSHS